MNEQITASEAEQRFLEIDEEIHAIKCARAKYSSFKVSDHVIAFTRTLARLEAIRADLRLGVKE